MHPKTKLLQHKVNPNKTSRSAIGCSPPVAVWENGCMQTIPSYPFPWGHQIQRWDGKGREMGDGMAGKEKEGNGIGWKMGWVGMGSEMRCDGKGHQCCGWRTLIIPMSPSNRVWWARPLALKQSRPILEGKCKAVDKKVRKEKKD